MNDAFFPNPVFGWVFLFALLAFLVVASYFDFRHFIIPNWLSVSGLVAGITISIIRRGLIGYEGNEPFMGALYGLLTSLGGFCLGFCLFLVFWLMGLCRGGDLKLFAAVASWLDWRKAFWLWLISFMILSVMLTVLALIRAVSRESESEPPGPPDGKEAGKGRKVPYAIPLTVAAVVVALLFFRKELRPAAAPANASVRQVQQAVAGVSVSRNPGTFATTPVESNVQ